MIASGERYLSEIDRVQNPAFGATLLWAYGKSYQSTVSSEASHLLLCFLILPLCFHRSTLDKIKGTRLRSGFGKFCEKLGEKREELVAVHERCLELRDVSFSAVSFGEQRGILSVDYGEASVWALDLRPPKYPERISDHVKGAEKLGTWFSSLQPPEIFRALRVEA